MWFKTRPLQFDSRLSHVRGLTLVELMVAIVLGMLITLAVSSMYIGQRVTSALGKQTSLLQEEGSRALDAMARDLRQAGDFNCASNADTNKTNTSNTLPSTLGIRGFASYSELSTSTLPGAAAIKDALASDTSVGGKIFAVSGALDSQSPILANVDTAATQVSVRHQDFASGQTAVLSDCINASVLKVSSYSHSSGDTGTLSFTSNVGGVTASGAAAVSYSASSSVARVETVWWFLGTPRFGNDVWPRGLYRVDGDSANATSGNGFKLISTRIQDVAFTYDRDTTATPDGVIDERSVSPSSIGTSNAEWMKVRRMHLEILLKSDTQVLPEKQSYYFNSATVTAADKRIYLPLELSTTLRNMY